MKTADGILVETLHGIVYYKIEGDWWKLGRRGVMTKIKPSMLLMELVAEEAKL